MIFLGIFVLAIMGTLLLVILDVLVYHFSFQSALLHLYYIPSNSSVGWFLGAALLTAGGVDLKNSALITRFVLMLSRKRG